MSTFHPATSSLANFKNTISTISTTWFFVYISCSHQDKNLRLSWHHSSSSFYLPTAFARATNEGIAVLEVWSNFPFAIKRILGIKCIAPCSFENKRIRLLTRVYGKSSTVIYTEMASPMKLLFLPNIIVTLLHSKVFGSTFMKMKVTMKRLFCLHESISSLVVIRMYTHNHNMYI